MTKKKEGSEKRGKQRRRREHLREEMSKRERESTNDVRDGTDRRKREGN